VVFDNQEEEVLKGICIKIEEGYQIKFLEIGTDKEHVHLLVQRDPRYNVTKVVRMIKSHTSREIFKLCPQLKKQL
jgi:putative transposase